VAQDNGDHDRTRSFAAGANGAKDAQGDGETRTSADRRDFSKSRILETLKSGTSVSHYRIIERIGAGGMGEVYAANDTHLKRKVALKFLAPQFALDEEFKDRFKREAQAAAQLNHQNVVTIYEVGEYDGGPFLAMEYVAGQSLSAVIRGSEVPLDTIVDIAVQICEGVKEAHKAGIVHRDLKPENIKMTEDGRIKILDFGLAKKLGADSVDEKGRIEGTLYYMSPEQVSGGELSVSTDIFSYGVVLYELLTGQRPFSGRSSANVIYSILHEDPVPPCDLNPDLPGWANVILLKLLSKSPEDRFRDMGAVIEFLESTGRDDRDFTEVGSYKTRRKTVTVIDLRNLSGDPSWDYFCEGFTEDLIREISRRSDLIVSAEPSSSQKCDIRAVFRRCRSDYAVTGTLMKWLDDIKLSLNCYGDGGDDLFFGEEYEGKSESLFQLLSEAARGASSALATKSGSSSISVDEAVATDISAYDYYLRGRSYYQTNKPEDLDFAARMYSKALNLDPKFGLAHTGLSDVHAFQYMAYYDRCAARIEQAKQEAEKALQIDPRLPEAHRSLGRYYMNIGDLDNAEKSFLKAVEISPKYAIGYRTLAWLNEAKGDLDGTMRWAKIALELAPTDLETLLLISLVYIDQKKYTLAIATLTRAIELGPDYGRAYYYLGTAYLKLGALDVALENMLLAAKYKGDPNSHIDAGYIYMINGDYESAEAAFKNSVDEECLTFIAIYYLGLLERLRGNREKAAEHFRRAIEVSRECEQHDPDNSTVLSYKAMALASVGDVERAKTLLNRLEVQSAHEGNILLNIARCYALMGDRARADKLKPEAVVEHAGPTEKELQVDPHFTLDSLD